MTERQKIREALSPTKHHNFNADKDSYGAIVDWYKRKGIVRFYFRNRYGQITYQFRKWCSDAELPKGTLHVDSLNERKGQEF